MKCNQRDLVWRHTTIRKVRSVRRGTLVCSFNGPDGFVQTEAWGVVGLMLEVVVLLGQALLRANKVISLKTYIRLLLCWKHTTATLSTAFEVAYKCIRFMQQQSVLVPTQERYFVSLISFHYLTLTWTFFIVMIMIAYFCNGVWYQISKCICTEFLSEL